MVSVYDQRNVFRQRWRWQEATELLDAANSEPCNSGLLAIFDDYNQRQEGAPPIVQALRPEWLDLAFADQARIENVVQEAIAIQPNISEKEFRKFIEGRARAIQNIAAFLVANMTFLEEDAEVRIGALAANTLAYFLAEPPTRDALIAVFQSIAASIASNTDGDQREIIRRSPLPPGIVSELKAWLEREIDNLSVAVAEHRLLQVISEVMISYSNASSIRTLSDRNFAGIALADWVSGRHFHAIHAKMIEEEIRVSGDKATIEDAVALCENGFGYDIAMIAASLADLIEPLDNELHAAFSKLQKQIKYGLTDMAAIAFLETGFSDRVVATILAVVWPNVTDRREVRALCRENLDGVLVALTAVPSYFSTVARELAA